MVDPLAEVVTLLQPVAAFSKVVSGAGRWRVHRSEAGQPFYCVILDGSCRLVTNGREPIILQTDDFVLIPEVYNFTMSSLEPPEAEGADTVPVALLVHAVGYLACLREPRVFDLWLTKVSRCPRVRNWRRWGCNSYAA